MAAGQHGGSLPRAQSEGKEDIKVSLCGISFENCRQCGDIHVLIAGAKMAIATVEIPTIPNGTLPVVFEKGQSSVFIGANGSGKTRLGVHLERNIPENQVLRIAAHRSLTMEDRLTGISYERAKRTLRTGYPDTGGQRHVHRWGGKPAVVLLSDFEALLQALFAENNHAAAVHLQAHTTTKMQSRQLRF